MFDFFSTFDLKKHSGWMVLGNLSWAASQKNKSKYFTHETNVFMVPERTGREKETCSIVRLEQG